MGEVYRARDTKLQRDVAIKVLPSSVAADAARLSRFRREAQLLASLNHPHIAAIYGVEDSDRVALVLELIEGPTIADRVARGAMPWKEAVTIAIQIADGLEAAHERGVIHRDLKPANVKLSSSGRAKVLDFGLAKLTPGAFDSGSDHETAAVTVASDHQTREGMLVGTIAYMSPEQARGQAIDKRTDIWAFGCVLFEMFAGRPPFAGATPTDTLAAIVEREPPWQALPAEIPKAIVDVVRRCLAKDPKRRFHDLADARLQLEDSLNAPASPVARRSVRSWVPMVTGLVAGVAVTAALAGLMVRRIPPVKESTAATLVARVVRFAISPDQLLDEQACGATNCGQSIIALSPDGRQIVYAARAEGTGQLYIRSVDQFDARPIPGTSGGLGPTFSPDGQSIAFIADRKLKTVPVSGGTPTMLVDSIDGRGLCWAADGNIYYNPGLATGIWKVPARGGTATAVASITVEFQDRFPDVASDGSTLFFSGSTRLGEEQVFVQSLRSGERRFVASGFAPHYLQTGHLVYVQSGRLMAVRFDLARMQMQGAPTVVFDGIEETTWGTPQIAFSPSGSILYIPASGAAAGNELVWVSLDGKVESTVPSAGRAYSSPRVSPAGRTIAAGIRGVPSDIWQYDLARETWGRFTFDGTSQYPVWSPDGRKLIYNSGKLGPTEFLSKPVDNTAPESVVLAGDSQVVPFSVSPDGRILVYVVVDPKNLPDIWTLSIDDPSKRRPFLQTPFREGAPVFSPDGHWIAYASDESGRSEIYVRPFPGPGQKWTISTEGGAEPIWPRKSQQIFYRNADTMMVVDVKTMPEFSASKPRRLFERAYERSDAYWPNYDATADGKRLLMLRYIAPPHSAQRQINVVLNWFDELKQRVP
jgi:Tol biopolymer transport system component/tRNA A-37 threonylcarbamoyl transferase component Bud32